MDENKIMKYEFFEPKHYSTLTVFIPLLCFLTVIEFFLIKNSFSDYKAIAIGLIWGFYLCFVYRTFFWTIFGREQIQITENNLIISKSGSFFVRPSTYNFREIRNIRIENRKFNFLDFFVSRTSLTSLKSWGCIVFDYKNKTINFGGNIDNTKAEKVIERIKTKVMT